MENIDKLRKAKKLFLSKYKDHILEMGLNMAVGLGKNCLEVRLSPVGDDNSPILASKWNKLPLVFEGCQSPSKFNL
jgi:hypothetical protein